MIVPPNGYECHVHYNFQRTLKSARRKYFPTKPITADLKPARLSEPTLGRFMNSPG